MNTPTNASHTAADRAADPQINILEAGYTPVILDGQILAVPLRPAPGGPEFVPAIVGGEAVAVPVHNPLAIAAAEPQPVPAAPVQPAPEQGMPLAVRQYLLVGSVTALAASGAVWVIGAAVAEVAPHADKLGEVLKWAAVLVGAVVIGVAALIGKLRSVTSGATSGSGASATASGDGASATGTVLALVHRTHQTNIGKQSAGWRGSITNHNG
ncbi:hypothetical protein [Kitasatospora sp. NBC_01302]|uniref:hypothetical protein n=1 Tax=Kitasatospora sp. NBC_01302 TaxID=2903575 RepID=UPI002E145AEA|nr:hypothetical protein OG294_40045 [Kitasatospora sp. NBC_01302]